MKRLLLLALFATAAGCSDSKVVVHATLAGSGEPVADLPVWVLPYDRQALMDSLAQDADEEEPAISTELLTQLEGLTTREKELTASGDSALPQVRTRRQAAQRQIDSIRVARREWRERVFARFDSLAQAREKESGGVAAVDTTDARGVARVSAGEGRAWVYAAYVLPDVTLEWNLPITVRGDSTTVRLTRENAREQRFY
jgi:hypothetical protein